MKAAKQILILAILALNSQLTTADWTVTPGVGTADGITLYADGQTIYAGTYFGAYRSTDNGNSWTSINNGFANSMHRVYDFYSNSGKLWCATEGSGLYYSTNNGNVWNREHGSYLTYSYAIAASSQYIIASSGSYCYYSTNMGSNWIIMDQGFDPDGKSGIVIKDNYVYSETSLSFLGSTSWSSIEGNLSGNSRYVNQLIASNNKLFIGTEAGIWSSTNNGTNWTNLNTALSTAQIRSIAVRDSVIILSSFSNSSQSHIYISRNNGSNWSEISTGLPANPRVERLAYNSNYVFAITENGFVYRRPFSEIVIGITPISTLVPDNFSISQNYPNPFNPTTNINFSVPKTGLVKITVFDIAGKEIFVIVNQQLTPGSYKVDFDGSKLSSGIYYYTLTAGDFVATKKMMLVK